MDNREILRKLQHALRINGVELDGSTPEAELCRFARSLVDREDTLIKKIDELESHLAGRWLNWETLKGRLDNLKSTITGDEKKKAKALDPKVDFLRTLYKESKPLYADVPDGERVIDMERALAIAKKKGIGRWGSYFQRLLEMGGRNAKGEFTKVIIKQEAIDALHAAGALEDEEKKK